MTQDPDPQNAGNTGAAAENETHFGFRTVREDEKAGLVRSVFDRVAGNYDVMNDVMSLGVHRAWKDVMVDWLDPRPGQAVLDVAGGTGDIAFRIIDRMARRGDPAAAPIVVSDINTEMLTEGTKRAAARAADGKPVPDAWVTADAECLPFEDKTMDIYTIAFGIRNVTHMDRALDEARRVLRYGGRFLCLEFSTVDVPGFDRLYDFWSFQAIPRLGGMVAGDRDSYQYLVESIRRFPDQKTFARRIEAAGFAQVSVRNLSGGIAALHSAWKV